MTWNCGGWRIIKLKIVSIKVAIKTLYDDAERKEKKITTSNPWIDKTYGEILKNNCTSRWYMRHEKLSHISSTQKIKNKK
jgi:hypothetical protein